jgi:hypothetical protein
VRRLRIVAGAMPICSATSGSLSVILPYRSARNMMRQMVLISSSRVATFQSAHF